MPPKKEPSATSARAPTSKNLAASSRAPTKKAVTPAPAVAAAAPAEAPRRRSLRTPSGFPPTLERQVGEPEYDEGEALEKAFYEKFEDDDGGASTRWA